MARSSPQAAAPETAAAPRRPGLARSQLRRMRRIVDAAIDLAERGGFEGVRLRDVAERSGVALGTLYRYFPSKEELLLFAFAEMIDGLEAAMDERPAAGASALERVREFFERTTRGLVQRPQLGRAVMRASATGLGDAAVRSETARARVQGMLVDALRGRHDPAGPDEHERAVAETLLAVWYAAALSWSAGVGGRDEISGKTLRAAGLLLASDGGLHG